MFRFLIALLWAGVTAPAPSEAQQSPVDPGLERLVQNYTGLYTRDSFEVWIGLFRPGFTSVSTNADGTLTLRALPEFLDAQRRGFQRAREMRETLENVRIEQQGRLASVWADFVFHYDGQASRGKLVLLAVSDTNGWRFNSLMFSYDR